MAYFGIPTSCLGVKRDCLMDVRKEIADLAKHYPATKITEQIKGNDTIEEKMDIEAIKDNVATKATELTPFKFLYRTSKSTRVFVPTTTTAENGNISKTSKQFKGQNFIEFTEKQDSKTYRKMLLKRMSNNPNRVKKK